MWGSVGEDVKKCFEVWGKVRRCGKVFWDVMWGSVGEGMGKYVGMWGR